MKKRAIDTNVVVRLITQDDPDQLAKVRSLLEDGSVLLLTTVILETEWVLRSAFGYSAERVAASLDALVSLPNIDLENDDVVVSALMLMKSGLDFADALHLAGADVCDEFLTFDAALVRRFARSQVALSVVPRLL